MSSSSTASAPTLAIFGATGGTCSAVLRHSLNAGLHVNVLARTPSKLTSKFPPTQYPNLQVIQGDIRDTAAVKKALTITEDQSSKVVDIVVSGLGMVSGPSDPTLCEDGVKIIFAGIEEIRGQSGGAKGAGPRVVVVSSTGISSAGRDIPILMVPLYKLLIGTPHADKRKMELVIQESGARWCIVRASLLVDGESKGLEKVRVGVEVPRDGGNAEVKKEIGYRIRREDVGLWIFGELVRGGGKGEWERKIVTLTY